MYKQISKNKWIQRFYYIDVDDRRKEKKITGTSKKETNEKKKLFLDNLEERKIQLKEDALAIEKNVNNITLNELYVPYFEFKKQSYKTSTAVTNKRRIEVELLPYFGDMRIYDVTSNDIVKWKTWIDNKGYSLEYSRSLYNLLSNMFSFAVSNYELLRNPVKIVGTFKRADEFEGTIHYWTYDDFCAFYVKINDILWQTFFSTLYFCGMRKGEAQSLVWNDIDLVTGTINITKTLTTKLTDEEKSKGLSYKLTPPKSKSSIRKIKMPNVLKSLLSDLYSNCKNIDGFNDQCFVFGTSRYIPDTSIRRNMHKYMKLANVPVIKVHDLRHSHASYLINHNANIMLVAKHLGHKDVKETLNTYSHLFPNTEDELIELMNKELDNSFF